MVCLGILLAPLSIAEASIFTNKNGMSNNGASRGSNLITATMSAEMHCVAPRDTILPRPFVGPSSEEKGLVRVATTGDNLMDPSITLDEVVYGEGMSSVTSDTNNANGELYFAAPQSIELPKPVQKNELRNNVDKSLIDCLAFLSSAIIYGASIMFLSTILVLLLCTNPMKTNASLPYFTVRNGSQKLRGRGCGLSNYLVKILTFATLIAMTEAETCSNIDGSQLSSGTSPCQCGTTDCTSNVAATGANCLEKAKAEFGNKVTQERTLQSGDWDTVPSGCSVQSGGDWAAHWNSRSGIDAIVAAANLYILSGQIPTSMMRGGTEIKSLQEEAISFDHSRAVHLIWEYVTSTAGTSKEIYALRQLKGLFAKLETGYCQRLLSVGNKDQRCEWSNPVGAFEAANAASMCFDNSQVGVCPCILSLAACCAEYSALLRATKGIDFFGFDTATSATSGTTMEANPNQTTLPQFPILARITRQVYQRTSVQCVFNAQRTQFAHELFMGRIGWIEGENTRLHTKVEGGPNENKTKATFLVPPRSVSLSCFATHYTIPASSTTSLPTAQHDRWIPMECRTLDAAIPLLVVPSHAGQRCCPFSAGLEMSLLESSIRYSTLRHDGGECEADFVLPALKIPSTTTTNATGWIFGMHNIWCALKAQYPKHTMHVLPRLSHALPFLFVSKYELNQMEPYSKQRLDAEATRELLFRRLLMLKGEEDIEEGEEEMASSIHSSNTMNDTNKRKSDTRTQRDQWIGERDEKLNIEFRLRALWSSWNHVLSAKGGMGKLFLSGDAGPGMLDMVLFCTLAMMRPVARLGDSLSLSSCVLRDLPNESIKAAVVGSWDNHIYVYSVECGRMQQQLVAHGKYGAM